MAVLVVPEQFEVYGQTDEHGRCGAQARVRRRANIVAQAQNQSATNLSRAGPCS